MDSRRVSSYSQQQQKAESNPFAQEAQGLAQLIQVDMQLDDLSQDLIQRIKFY